MSLMVDCDGNLMTSCEGTLMSGWTITVQGLNLNTLCWPVGWGAYQNWFKDKDGNWVTSLDGTYDITCQFSPDGGTYPPEPTIYPAVKIGEVWLAQFAPQTDCSGEPRYDNGYPVKQFDITFYTFHYNYYHNLILGVPGNALFLAPVQVGVPMSNDYQSPPGYYRPTYAWGGTCIIR